MTADHGGPAPAGFATLLRQARRTAGLTQEQLAAKAGVGVRTVRDLERGRASRPQRTTVALIADALGLPPAERSRFVDAARGGAPEAEPATTIALPSAGPLVGRDTELVTIAELLAQPGIVSLVGLAGVGKTSLGLAAAHQLGGQFPGGVAGVGITEVSVEADILAAVASVFGVARADDLPARLGRTPALLLADSTEQSDAAAAALAGLCARAPALRVLACGRRALGLAEERVVAVAPLEAPPAEASDLATVESYPAGALFLQRLSEVRREPLRDSEAPAIAALVRRLGGLPLAVELAAARCRVLDPGELLARYGDRLLDLPSPTDRPAQALRDAIAGSYGLLDDRAQRALRRLSVFRARWSLELAEELIGPDDDPVALLDRLIELGLVSIRGTGTLRFRLLDVVRDFATEQATPRELAEARGLHALVLARVAARAAPQLAGAGFADAVTRLDHLASDVRAALAYATEADPVTALTLAARLPRWWRFRGRDVPGRLALQRLLADPRTAGADRGIRAWARLGVAQLAQEHGAGLAELSTVEQALVGFQQQADVTGELTARNVLCALLMADGAYDDARRHGEAALALATRTGRVRDMAVAHNNLTWHEIRVGDLAAASRRLAAVDRLAAECGERRLRALARVNLAEVARLDGRYEEAVSLARGATPLLDELGDPGHRQRLLGIVGKALAQSGRLAEAADVVADLRRATGEDEATAAIEGYAALHRGDRALATEWFTAAAAASTGHRDARDLVEALVGLAASTADPVARTAVLTQLSEVRSRGGVTLLPAELALLHA